jgi:hypothetical protein
VAGQATAVDPIDTKVLIAFAGERRCGGIDTVKLARDVGSRLNAQSRRLPEKIHPANYDRSGLRRRSGRFRISFEQGVHPATMKFAKERGTAERLWRVRKDSRTMEALIRTDDGSGSVEIEFLYNGQSIHTHHLPDRALAIEEASSKLAELVVSGWARHW